MQKKIIPTEDFLVEISFLSSARAAIHPQKKAYDLAKNLYYEVLVTSPENAEANFNLAALELIKEKDADYISVIKLLNKPNFSYKFFQQALLMCALAFYKLGKIAECEKAIKEIEMQPLITIDFFKQNSNLLDIKFYHEYAELFQEDEEIKQAKQLIEEIVARKKKEEAAQEEEFCLKKETPPNTLLN